MTYRDGGNLSATMVCAILAVVGMLAAGQVLFKYAARTLDFSRPVTFLSFPLGAALILYCGATVLWLLVLTKVSLTIAFPFYGLVFLLVPLLSWIVLKEPVNLPTLIGSVVIALGVVIVATGSRV
jgi:drug/metabolite transporter (DMT)-like permease